MGRLGVILKASLTSDLLVMMNNIGDHYRLHLTSEVWKPVPLAGSFQLNVDAAVPPNSDHVGVGAVQFVMIRG